jgi:pyruvate-formate lyase-activating enzyme
MKTAQEAFPLSSPTGPLLLIMEGSRMEREPLLHGCSSWLLSKARDKEFVLASVDGGTLYPRGGKRKKIYQDILSNARDGMFIRVKSEKDKVPPGLVESILDFRNRNEMQYTFFDGRMLGLRDLLIEISEVSFTLKLLDTEHPFLPSGQLNYAACSSFAVYTPSSAEFRHLQEVNLDLFNGPPAFLAVEATPRCNLRCRMCPNHGEHPRFNVRREEEIDIPAPLFHNLLGQAAEMGVKNLTLSLRGEPFLHPEIERFIRNATDRGFRVGTTTNGTLLRMEFLKRLHGAGLKGVTISIDSLNRHTLKRLRAGVNPSRLLQNIEHILEFKHALPQGEFLVGVNCVVVEDAEEEEIVARYLPSMDTIGFGKRLLPESGRFQGRFLHLKKVRRFPCRFPYTVMLVKSDGHAVKCGMSVLEGEDAGDVSASSLRDVWHGEFYRRVRNAHQQGEWNQIPSCRKCEQWLAWMVVEERRGDVIIRTSPLTREYSRFKSDD